MGMSEVLISEPQEEGKGRLPIPPNLILRVITAAVGVPVTLVLVGLGGWPLFALALLIGVLAQLEMFLLARRKASPVNQPLSIGLLIASLLLTQIAVGWIWFLAWLVVGTLGVIMLAPLRGAGLLRWRLLLVMGSQAYISLPLALMLHIRGAASDGALWLLWILLLTWVTDSASYFVGRFWGKRSLAPRISPKKTWEGAVGGWLAGALVGYCFLQFTGLYTWVLVPLCFLAPMLAILGDLWESALKRTFQQKDSRLASFNLFPGHGGVLDRIDALLFVAPGVVIYLAALTPVFAG